METLHWHLILISSRKSKRKMRWVWHNSSSMQHPRPFEKITFSVLQLQNTIPETSTANTHHSLPFLLVGVSIISTESRVKWAWTSPQFLLVLAPIGSTLAAHLDWHGNLGLDSILGFDTFVQINLHNQVRSMSIKHYFAVINYQVQLQLPTELWRDWKAVSLRAYSRAQKSLTLHWLCIAALHAAFQCLLQWFLASSRNSLINNE